MGESAILKLALFTVALFVQFDGGVIDVRNVSNLKLPRHPIRIYWEKNTKYHPSIALIIAIEQSTRYDMLAQP